MDILCTRVIKTLTDLQILGCQLHPNAFGGLAAWLHPHPLGSYSTPPDAPSDPLAVIK